MATMSSGTEPFPQLYARDQLKPLSAQNAVETKVTRRRKSSGLGQEIRAGDTGAPAIATLDVRPPSPGTVKVSTFCIRRPRLQTLTNDRHEMNKTGRSPFLNGGKQRA